MLKAVSSVALLLGAAAAVVLRSDAPASVYSELVCEPVERAVGTCVAADDCWASASGQLKSCSQPGAVCCPTVRPSLTRVGDKSREMCKKYSEIQKVTNCPPVEFIPGSNKAMMEEFPFMGVVGFGDDDENVTWACSGNLISERFVMTAAHCLRPRAHLGHPRYVRLGDPSLKKPNDDANVQQLKVVEWMLSPQFKHTSYYHDIGLLKLEQDVKFDSFVRPACLYTNLEIPVSKGIVTGWGATLGDDEQNILRKVDVKIYPASECNRTFSALLGDRRLGKGFVDELLVCAGDLQGGRDTCNGDNGSGLIVRLDAPLCMPSIVATTSFGRGLCGAKDSLAGYSRVLSQLPWIEKTVWPDS